MKRFYEAQALAIAMVVLVVSSIIAVSVYSRVLKDKGLSVEERASAEALEVSDLILDKVTTFSVNQLVDILRPENEDFPYEEGITLKEDGKNKTEIADLLVTLGIQNPFSDVGFCKTGDGNEYSLSIKAANANSPYEVRAGQIWSLPIKASVLPNGCTLNLKVGEGDSGAGFMIIKTYAKYTGDVATEYKEYTTGDITNYCFSTDSSSCTNTNFNNDSWENYISPNSVITIPTTGSGTFKLEDIRLKAIGGNVAISYDMRDSSNVSCIQGFRMFEVKVSAFCDGVYRGKSILIPERKWSNALFDYSIFNGEGSL